MPVVVVTLPIGASAKYPKVAIVTESGAVVTLPYAPNEIEHSNHAPLFVQQTRPARDPLLQRAGGQLAEMKFTAAIVRPNAASIEDVLAQLLWVIASGERVRVGYTLLTAGLWRITADTITELDHVPGTNQCNKATVELTFTRASESQSKLGPVTGGAKTAAKPIRTIARGGDSSAELKQRTRTDLTAGELADQNGIRDFRKVAAGASIRPGS